jgi:hypothetical protein
MFQLTECFLSSSGGSFGLGFPNSRPRARRPLLASRRVAHRFDDPAEMSSSAAPGAFPGFRRLGGRRSVWA